MGEAGEETMAGEITVPHRQDFARVSCSGSGPSQMNPIGSAFE